MVDGYVLQTSNMCFAQHVPIYQYLMFAQCSQTKHKQSPLLICFKLSLERLLDWLDAVASGGCRCHAKPLPAINHRAQLFQLHKSWDRNRGRPMFTPFMPAPGLNQSCFSHSTVAGKCTISILLTYYILFLSNFTLENWHFVILMIRI